MGHAIRVALVGCGAVSRENLLPVLAGHDGVALGPLVDRDERRARELADAYGVSSVLTDAAQLSREQVDAVILATPPSHHAPATIALAAKGLHVFVEKPMAITAGEAGAMVEAAERAGVALSVGLYRRFLPSVQLLNALIERLEFGRPLSVDAEEGGPYGWQLATLDVLRRSSGGGGVLIDLGSHVLDLILYILKARARLERYEDNHRGGIETDSVLRASLDAPFGTIPLRLELSRTRELRGSIYIECEDATLELRRGNFTEVLVHRRRRPALDGGPIQLSAAWNPSAPFTGYEAFRREIDDWLTAISQRSEPILCGRSVVPIVALIEHAYQSRLPLAEPGDTPDDSASAASPRVDVTPRRRVLVTGAGGFLGGRAVEMLRERYGWDVVPLVREPRSAARLARWPHEILLGDVCSRADMDRVVKGCDAVVHCAVGTSWKADEARRVTIEGTRVVAEAALAAGVKRFVHISTLFVHQRTGVTEIDETTPRNPPAADQYGRAKLDAERALVTVAARGLWTIVLRPTRIYGPFSRTFTIRPLQALSQGRLAVGGDASVPGNMVYVDNVVGVIARALEANDGQRGQAYLVTDEEQTSLGEFYDFFARPFGLTVRLRPEMSDTANHLPTAGLLTRWLAGLRAIARSPELRGIVRRVLETDPVGTLPRRWWDRSPGFQRAMLKRFGADAAVVYRPATAVADEELVYFGEHALVSGAKAAKELGAVPVVKRSDAMARTLDWACYARLLPSVTD